MQGHRRRLIVPAVIAIVLLVPAVIWSGMQHDTAKPAGVPKPKGISKMPEVVTVGPEMVPYVLTAGERAKLSRPMPDPLVLDDPMRMDTPDVPLRNDGPYPGMTPAELEKLARWRASAPQALYTQPATAGPEKPTATIELVPRVRGIEGLTPSERAKLEAYLESRSR